MPILLLMRLHNMIALLSEGKLEMIGRVEDVLDLFILQNWKVK